VKFGFAPSGCPTSALPPPSTPHHCQPSSSQHRRNRACSTYPCSLADPELQPQQLIAKVRNRWSLPSPRVLFAILVLSVAFVGVCCFESERLGLTCSAQFSPGVAILASRVGVALQLLALVAIVLACVFVFLDKGQGMNRVDPSLITVGILSLFTSKSFCIDHTRVWI
jgi:hypothetical protein